MSEKLTAYNVRTKEKNVPIEEAVISKTKKGAYMVKGKSADGATLTTLVNAEKAHAAVEGGVATWAPGFEPKAAEEAEETKAEGAE